MTCGGVHCHHHHPSPRTLQGMLGLVFSRLLHTYPVPNTYGMLALCTNTHTHTRSLSLSLSLSQSQYLSSEYDPKRNREKHALSPSYHRQTLPQGCFCFGEPFLYQRYFGCFTSSLPSRPETSAGWAYHMCLAFRSRQPCAMRCDAVRFIRNGCAIQIGYLLS
ncbi:hypothetical protein LY76DRAFT_279666 [Colletotrichum caudatum]|nr:hypothetical protein LY76DRAFT_279666 [Colletotrichum caudatum]